MDIDTLRTKRDEVSKRFEELQTVTTKQKQDNEAELFRLQGEYRALNGLVYELEPEENKPAEDLPEKTEVQE